MLNLTSRIVFSNQKEQKVIPSLAASDFATDACERDDQANFHSKKLTTPRVREISLENYISFEFTHANLAASLRGHDARQPGVRFVIKCRLAR